MTRQHTHKTVQTFASCLILITAMFSAMGADATPSLTYQHRAEPLRKSFAVFVAAYNRETHEARGGVAGTAFFTSPTTAITAFHVLQNESFKARAATEEVQVWLVHEGEPAIELKRFNLSEKPEKDLTFISLKPAQAVPRKFVFSTGKHKLNASVRTEGFFANSVGPTLAIDGYRLKIVDVPALNRLNINGQIELQAKVNLNANDVKLRDIPCLRLSYQAVVGLSGGPVISEDGGVIGMNSFADPSTSQLSHSGSSAYSTAQTQNQNPSSKKTWAVTL